MWVVQVWASTGRSFELASAIASGAMTREDVLADNFGLVRGLHSGRISAEEITVYKNGELSVEADAKQAAEWEARQATCQKR